MRRALWGALAVAALAGCNGPGRLNQETCERIAFPLMSRADQAEYHKRPTWLERKAYLYEIKVLDKFEEAPPAIQRAILDRRVIQGMNPDQVLMSWGQPADRSVVPASPDPEVARREGRKERWLYDLVISTADLGLRFLRAVEFTNDVVLYVRDDRPR